MLGTGALVLRFFEERENERLLLVNLGHDLVLSVAPEPLLGQPGRGRWDMRWSSEDPKYGGRGTPAIETDVGWHIPAETAVVLAPSHGERSSDA